MFNIAKVVQQFDSRQLPSTHRDELLSKQLLPTTRRLAGDTFVFQKDSTSVQRARNTMTFWLVFHRFRCRGHTTVSMV